MFRIDADRLRPLLHARLRALDVDPVGAGHVVDSLVQTSLRGVDSHGIQLFPHYVRAVAAGRVSARPQPVLARTAASTARLDADHAFGHHAGALAIDAAVDIARETGLGAVSVRDSTHFGAAAYFALRAADAGMIGLSFTNADALVKAFNAREPVFGTNPLCFAAPLRDEGPLCLDMATSLVSWNKVRNARVSGAALGGDWAFDAAGQPTTDADAAASLSPAGGYKGYGLGMMVEVLCGLLADGPIARELLPMFSAPIEARRHLSHFFLALDLERFVPGARFRARLQGLVDAIRAMTPMQAHVMVPGDPEKRAAVERARDGIPATQALLDAFAEAGAPVDGALRS
ncbi:MAG: Ldh family oxidoreductase [Nevskiaceae bacterium]